MTAIAARCRTLLAGLATAALLAMPAAAGATTAPGDAGCREAAVAQPFASWGDEADYFLAPDGGFEQGGAGWALSGGAEVTGGNERFHVVSPGDRRSLRLPAGSSAATAPFCIGVDDRTIRLFTRAAPSSSLSIDVLYADADGTPRAVRAGELSGAGGWAPSDVVPMVVNALAAARGNAMDVRLRFSAHGASTWAIDDVHVDPYRGR